MIASLNGSSRSTDDSRTQHTSAAGRARVTSIRRVQNIRLWTKFQLRRHEVLEQAGGAPWRFLTGPAGCEHIAKASR